MPLRIRIKEMVDTHEPRSGAIRFLPSEFLIKGGIAMRRFLLPFAILVTFTGFFGCGEDELPRTRVKNETGEETNISFKQGNDPTININGTQPGATSAFREIREAHTLVTGLPDKDSLAFGAERGSDYTVVVQTDNSRIEVSGQ